MKKYLVIGSPIEHSLSPKLHNYWFKINKIQAIYDKKKLHLTEIKSFIENIRAKKIEGVNVTVPFKKEVIPYLDQLSEESEKTQSVNTIYQSGNKLVGYNTDVYGFKKSLQQAKFDIKNKKIFILGAGGVVPSLIFALKKMNVAEIVISNRTQNKAENLKKLFDNLEVIEWGRIPNFDTIINATSIGLNEKDIINLDFSKIGQGKLFYDLIYNPNETNFLKTGKKLGNIIENGKMMFIYQASAAFKIWHGIEPNINKDVIKLLDK